MEMTTKQLVENFKPEFGTANHIAALPLIMEWKKLRAKLDGHDGREAPTGLLRDFNNVDARVLGLLRPRAPLSTYPPNNQNV